MRVLIVSLRGPTNAARRGGAQDYVRFAAGPWTRRGVEVHLLCAHERLPDGSLLPEREVVDGIRVARVGSPGRRARPLRRAALTSAAQADVVVENIMGFPLFLPLGLPKNVALVALKHHFQRDTFVRSQGRVRGTFGRLLEDGAFPLVYRDVPLVVPSAMTAAHVEDQWTARRAPLEIIPPGVPLPDTIDAVRAKRPTVLYLGGLHLSRKRVDHLIEAFRRAAVPEARLLIAGDGPDRAALEAQAEGLAVEFLGFVSEARKHALMEEAWVFASPSLQEGFGITWIEANAHGLPIVGYHVEGLDTVDDTCARMVDPSDVEALTLMLRDLLTDAALRDTLSQGARRNAHRFDVQRTSDDLLAVLRHAAGLPAASPSHSGPEQQVTHSASPLS